jgi:hypothetical protein
MGVEPRDAGKWKTGMDRRTEDKLASLSTAKPARDTRARWNWVEPEVWTDRMLTAPEQGVKGEQWFRYRWTHVFFCGTRAVLFVRNPCFRTSILRQGDRLTGEPDAGDPPVRFGGRGNSGSPSPYSEKASFFRSPFSPCVRASVHEERRG